MIEPEQVQNAVDEKPGQAVLQKDAGLLGLARGGGGRNDHVTEKLGSDIGKVALAHGESKNVGGAVLLAVFPVEFPDPYIVYEQDGQFAVRAVQVV